MKRFEALWLGVLFIAFASAVYSQSLAELASKERERRRGIKDEARVITNADAEKYRSAPVTTASIPAEPSPEAPAEPGEDEAAEKETETDPDEPVDLQGRPESFWRRTMAAARQKVKDLETQANVLILRLNELQNRFYSEDDGFKREWIGREIQKTIFEQDQNRENLVKAKDALEDLEKEARKSGALPGWISAKNP
jgi:hypothetical protein